MYSILVSAAIAVSVAMAWTFFGPFGGWPMGVFLGMVALVVSWILIARRLGRRIEPAMRQVHKLAESGRFDLALQNLEDLLPVSKWIPMVRGQILAQMGVLAHHAGDDGRAVQHLERASRRASDAKALLASIRYRDGDVDGALRVLDAAAPFNRTHALLHNLHAYLLHREGRTSEAMARLNFHLKKDSGNAASKDNLLRLQNERKMNMKQFGMPWYALGLQRPPASMGQVQTARRGFRQRSKRRG